jgi:hypothetical protein
VIIKTLAYRAIEETVTQNSKYPAPALTRDCRQK